MAKSVQVGGVLARGGRAAGGGAAGGVHTTSGECAPSPVGGRGCALHGKSVRSGA